MMLRHSDGERWRDEATNLVTNTTRNKLGIQVVGANQSVRSVLFGGTNRNDDAARCVQVLLDLLPGGQRELHKSSPETPPMLSRTGASRNSVGPSRRACLGREQRSAPRSATTTKRIR